MILVVDNYDSFTHNLVHYAEAQGAALKLIRNDDMSAVEALALDPRAIILSPGPGAPDQAGICLDLVARAPPALPILGVCLGHQIIAQAFGARIGPAKSIMHGKVSAIHHSGEGVFAALPAPFNATRYHSLAIAAETLPAMLTRTAWTADGEIMGIAHRTRPLFGVQFHPESIASAHGRALLANFLALA